ncbi:hypothetical protein ACO0LV_02910 [Pseudactinotalea sp. Z1739]|uniref:hypothetical protein n=1 Tax=Pseudactinotalea sp. Z1739 TaxID=3413028 RepID=UPI003C7EDA08
MTTPTPPQQSTAHGIAIPPGRATLGRAGRDSLRHDLVPAAVAMLIVVVVVSAIGMGLTALITGVAGFFGG